MQLMYGVAGSPPATRPVFERLGALALDSNPGLRPRVEHGDCVSLGVAARAFNTWKGEALTLFLDGEIWSIDGQATAHKGRTPGELEQIARLYRRYGAGVWSRLDGSYCLLIEDGDTLRIGVDINSKRTLYYWLHDGVLAWGTQVLDLAPAYPAQLTEDWSSISVFLTCGANIPQRTAWREIGHLAAGCGLVFEAGSVHVEEYFRQIFMPQVSRRPDERLPEELADVLHAAVDVAWRAAERPVVPLSGGTDSRYITAEIAALARDRSDVRTITWGTHRERPGSDAEVAARVAEALGVENVWHEKPQNYDADQFARAVYLSNGEGDAAVHYPDDPRLNRSLAEEWGFGSSFRGETLFTRFRALMTDRAVVPTSVMARLYRASRYGALLDTDLFSSLVDANKLAMDEIVGNLRSPTPNGKFKELYHWYRLRQIQGTYNKAKHAHLEVYSPLLERPVLAWLSTCPEWAYYKPALFDVLQKQRFPELAAIPFATRSNLPAWRARFGSEPELARFWAEQCAVPGWLSQIGAQEKVVAGWQAIEATATNAPPASTSPRTKGWKDWLKQTVPGRLLHELTFDRRHAAALPPYLMLARLAVLHGLLGRVASRKAYVQAFEPMIRQYGQ